MNAVTHPPGPLPPRPPGVTDAGRRALLVIGSRVAGFYQAGVVLAALLSPPPSGHLVAWAGAVALAALCATGLVGALTRPVRPTSALLFAASSAGLLLALVAWHPSLGARETQVLVGSAISAAAGGAALSWGPATGLLVTAWLLGTWAGPVRMLEGDVDPSLFATALAGGLLGATGSVFLRRGYILTQRALAAAEEAVATRTLAAARWRARRHEIRVLHDTVLSTLSLVAQGGRGVDETALLADCRTQARLLRKADARASRGPGPAQDGAGVAAAEPMRGPATTGPSEPVVPPGSPGSPGSLVPPEPGAAVFDQLRRRWATRSLEVHVYGTDDALRLHGVRTTRASALLGAVEECLENVRRHAGVAVASVSVTRSGRQLQCTVTDEGVGFDPAAPRSHRIGLGDSVVSRIEEAGGEARVWSAPGQGTTVALWVPVDDGPGPEEGP